MGKSKLCAKHCEELEPLSSWFKLASVVVLHIIVATPETTFGIFYDYLRERYDSNTAVIGWIFFVFYISSCIMGKSKDIISKG